MSVSSLASPFPILFLTSPCLFCSYQLCFLIPAPFPPFSPVPFPADNPPNDLHTYDSISILFVCLVCFLDSVVDSCEFVAILMFIVLILFFLSPFDISCNSGLVMMNSFSFTLFGKHYMCPSILNDSFSG